MCSREKSYRSSRSVVNATAQAQWPSDVSRMKTGCCTEEKKKSYYAILTFNPYQYTGYLKKFHLE